jgi:hypothetical protein
MEKSTASMTKNVILWLWQQSRALFECFAIASCQHFERTRPEAEKVLPRRELTGRHWFNSQTEFEPPSPATGDVRSEGTSHPTNRSDDNHQTGKDQTENETNGTR